MACRGRGTTGGRLAVAEIETLTVDEPLAERIERHNFDRLLMLSDGVFAIAVTLLALELRPPEHWNGQLDALLTALLPIALLRRWLGWRAKA